LGHYQWFACQPLQEVYTEGKWGVAMTMWKWVNSYCVLGIVLIAGLTMAITLGNKEGVMAFPADGAMPDVEALKAENDRLIAKMHEAEDKGERMQDLSRELQLALVDMPWQVSIGGFGVLFGVFWFLIRR
jgi:hypothetical protein